MAVPPLAGTAQCTHHRPRDVRIVSCTRYAFQNITLRKTRQNRRTVNHEQGVSRIVVAGR